MWCPVPGGDDAIDFRTIVFFNNRVSDHTEQHPTGHAINLPTVCTTLDTILHK